MSEPDYTVQAVDRALLVLETVAANPGISLVDLAKRSGCTKTLAFRMASPNSLWYRFALLGGDSSWNRVNPSVTRHQKVAEALAAFWVF